MTLDEAIKAVANVFETVNTNKEGHRQLDLVLQTLIAHLKVRKEEPKKEEVK